MQIQDLARVYHTKTNEELLQLVEDSGQLTPEARVVLDCELARRRINPVADLRTEEESDQGRIERRRPHETLFRPDSHVVSEFVTEVLRVYHSQFWLFVKLIVPAIAVGYVAVVMGRNEGREIARHLPRGIEMLGHQTELMEIWFANLAGYLVSWMVFSFCFGAICSAVRQTEVGIIPSVPGSFAVVRERMGSLLCLSLLLFLLLLVVEAVAGLAGAGTLWVLHQRQSHVSSFSIYVVSFGFVSVGLLLLSRFGLAIPALVLDNCRVGQAIFRSDELTEGKWLTLAVLLAKSIMGGYAAGMLPFWLASWIRASTPLPAWFPWALTVASFAGVTVVEPTMFIGFALLYLRTSASPSSIDAPSHSSA